MKEHSSDQITIQRKRALARVEGFLQATAAARRNPAAQAQLRDGVLAGLRVYKALNQEPGQL